MPRFEPTMEVAEQSLCGLTGHHVAVKALLMTRLPIIIIQFKAICNPRVRLAF